MMAAEYTRSLEALRGQNYESKSTRLLRLTHGLLELIGAPPLTQVARAPGTAAAAAAPPTTRTTAAHEAWTRTRGTGMTESHFMQLLQQLAAEYSRSKERHRADLYPGTISTTAPTQASTEDPSPSVRRRRRRTDTLAVRKAVAYKAHMARHQAARLRREALCK
jgi:hypothetical protein